MDDLPVISSYTRAQALADDVLHDVTMVARDAGFVWPVALTDALWRDIGDIPSRLTGIASVEGRLWDCIWMAFCAIKRAAGDGSELRYQLIMPVGAFLRQRYDVRLVCGPGDDGEPVITLMRPDES